MATILPLAASAGAAFAQDAAGGRPSEKPSIPLPEHPRPDWQREHWLNLNGHWRFQFDPDNTGEEQGWYKGDLPGNLQILVPFPWGSKLSGVEDRAEIGWYSRTIEVPAEWKGRRVFVVIGASDWRTTVWLDGVELGTHEGGYTPFEFELTPHVKFGQAQRLVVRADDKAREFKLEGKQGYGNARGIWQTPYLEARGSAALGHVHFSPDIQKKAVTVQAALLEPAPADLTLTLDFATGGVARATQKVPKGSDRVSFTVAIPEMRLWSLEDPFLYEVEAKLEGGSGVGDAVRTYFGMRQISVVNLPGTEIPYIALNGEPIYLQLTLDQAYHPDGYYSFPSDEFTRDEVLRARQIGLNGLRVHVKVPLPRKLYWADRLGMLIMADVPNSWGEPTPEMRKDVEHALRGMIARDYNHPSIFAWIPFNETWGLRHREGKDERGRDKLVYRQETKEWVASVVRLAKQLDPTRLVEDNSVCCNIGHVGETDINSWHSYLAGWEWEEHLEKISDMTYPGSQWNFEPGWKQGRQPNINSEFGNVWGYEGSTGDVDYTWDYHLAVNAFRRYPKIAGWLYTEHHDVINEWNGYWRFDRSNKITGLDELVEGMSLRDFHSPFYLSVGKELSRSVKPGETVSVPVFASFLTGTRAHGDSLVLRTELYGWNSLGRRKTFAPSATRRVPYKPWMTGPLDPIEVKMPDEPAVVVLATFLESPTGTVLQRNFTTFVVEGETPTEVTLDGTTRARLVTFEPASFKSADWSLKQWSVMDGAKVNGAGAGFFEYRVAWPKDVQAANLATVTFLAEAGAKRLHGKDRDDADEIRGDYMRGLGTLDPSRNPNAYPMTDETPFPSAVNVIVNGVRAGRVELADDFADHRGILSWHYQLRDKRLREAGSYGQLLRVDLPREAIEKAAAAGEIVIRLEVDEALPGGLAIYGKRFGRYPLDPTLLFVTR
ncbi:MAG TPA: glycoside hydrolase family 2 TIM barrel-domain containing protein [Vicinamibacterales bacterium]|nr:glycoside hydrolase family 2 TIM barrel-domain containing protein [Vicinamibacterales bacterium]